jgi:hypothetical protein
VEEGFPTVGLYGKSYVGNQQRTGDSRFYEPIHQYEGFTGNRAVKFSKCT